MVPWSANSKVSNRNSFNVALLIQRRLAWFSFNDVWFICRLNVQPTCPFKPPCSWFLQINAYTSSQDYHIPIDHHIEVNSLPVSQNHIPRNLPASILRGESGSGDSSNALTAVQAVEIVQAGLHWLFNTSRQISPVWNQSPTLKKRNFKGDYLEMDIRMAYWSGELDLWRDIWIPIRNSDV